MFSVEDKSRNRKIKEYMGGVFVPKADLWDLTAGSFFHSTFNGITSVYFPKYLKEKKGNNRLLMQTHTFFFFFGIIQLLKIYPVEKQINKTINSYEELKFNLSKEQ